jgi:predicted O-methyltransferase YrrM
LKVVEIGTATGASALAMLRYLGPAGSLTTVRHDGAKRRHVCKANSDAALLHKR